MKRMTTVLILAAFWAAPARADEPRLPPMLLLPNPAVPLAQPQPQARQAPGLGGFLPAPAVRGARPKAPAPSSPMILPELRSRFSPVPMPSFEPEEALPQSRPVRDASRALGAARQGLGMDEKSPAPAPSALRSAFDGLRR